MGGAEIKWLRALRIFVGSSSEASDLAGHVAEIIQSTGMVATRWNDDAFAAGRTLLGQIESFPFDYDGAVLLVTPDVACARKDRRFDGPVANVTFEYGYLGARLTLERVAICRFHNAEMPSDVAGVKLIEDVEYIEYPASRLSQTMVDQLATWLNRLPRLANSIPATVQLHGYSGRWRVRNSFHEWHRIPIEPPDEVYFDGLMTLSVPVDGKSGGTGIMYGETYVSIGNYRATLRVVNEVRNAVVAHDGGLYLTLEVVRRDFRDESGLPPPGHFREPLRNPTFNVDLAPRSDEPKLLRGRHLYDENLKSYSSADEEYLQIG